MAEEIIRVKEDVETVSKPSEPAEPMGTVISMESVKPASAENFIQQVPEAPQKAEEPADMSHRQASEERPDLSERPEREVIFHEPPVVERKEDISSTERTEAFSHDREKKRVSDFIHMRKNMEDFTREDWILSRIPEEDLMEYLTMEQKKSEMLQKAKEVKEKRIFTTLQIAISMSAIVGVVALLKDNPTVLVNILYITGIVIALWIWRGKQDK